MFRDLVATDDLDNDAVRSHHHGYQELFLELCSKQKSLIVPRANIAEGKQAVGYHRFEILTGKGGPHEK